MLIPCFGMRAVYECGWNVFQRKGFSTEPHDIAVNYSYLRHLHKAGINWLVVFWTNSPAFDAAWAELVPFAHNLGIKVARGVYGFSGGGPEYSMAEPDAPQHLLRHAPRGNNTALCPHDAETQAWMAARIALRLEPSIDAIFVEPAREINRHCTCKRCQTLLPYNWDVYVLNFCAQVVAQVRPEVKVVPYVYQPGDAAEKALMAAAFTGLHPSIDTIFSWGSDSSQTLIDWLNADPRFCHFAKLGRTLLFPGGANPADSVEIRVQRVFNWCRLAAESGRPAYMFDYRIFGGREWEGHENDVPMTRINADMPASLGVIGSAMQNPYLSDSEQLNLLNQLRTHSDWDLDDPAHFYQGRRC